MEVRSELERTIYWDPNYVAASQAVENAQGRAAAADRELLAARQDLAAARQHLADKQAARQDVAEWANSHGLPDPP